MSQEKVIWLTLIWSELIRLTLIWPEFIWPAYHSAGSFMSSLRRL